MKVEIIESTDGFTAPIVKLDGENVGSLNPDFHPVKGLHHKRVAMIEREISKLRGSAAVERQVHNLEVEGSIPSPATQEPPMDWDKGDKTPAYIEWFRATHTPEEFKTKYAHRNIL
jgi:hypothetical protein